MKYIQRTSKKITSDFLMELLIDRGIIPYGDLEYQTKFINPTVSNLLEPTDLDNMDEGFQMFKKHLENGSKFYICIDSDFDGFSSAAVLYNYMIDYLKPIYPNFEISYHVPDGKIHGLDTIMDVFTNGKICDIIILPDSSSNDHALHKTLRDLNYDILVLDHHSASHYSEDAVVINNQLSEQYENKDLSGVGIVYKFLQYCDRMFGLNGSKDYLDLVASGMDGTC